LKHHISITKITACPWNSYSTALDEKMDQHWDIEHSQASNGLKSCWASARTN